MKDNPERFVCMAEPSGRWTVWDTVADEPASFDGRLLMGQERQRAQTVRDLLERIHRSGLHTPTRG